MEENRFKEGDKVYHFMYGWGTVTLKYKIRNSEDVYVEVNFGDSHLDYFQNFKDGFLLSFTEYTLFGFSQERPEELPKKGDIVWVKDEYHSQWTIGHFYKKLGNEYYISISPSLNGWTTKGNQITTINPNENEK